jgi:hypothetical protein
MKTILSVLILVITVVTSNAFALPGSGTESDPYRIESLADFNEFASDQNYLDDYTRLETDINLAGMIYTTAVIAPMKSFFDTNVYSGVFDGNNHTISNLTINTGGRANEFLGLFGKTDVNSVIRNLAIKDCNIIVDNNSSHYIGALSGYINGSILNCYTSGSITVDEAGAVGGLVGYIYNGIISKSYSTCTISGYEMVGGLVGYYFKQFPNTTSNVSNCYATGSVSGYTIVGGLIGVSLGSVSNCYATGSVSGNTDVGGLCGLFGDGYYSYFANCFWDMETSSVTEEGQGIGKTTEEMKQKITFTNWDFVEIWGIEDNQTYPFLRLIYPIGDLDFDKKVDFTDFAIFANRWLEGVE